MGGSADGLWMKESYCDIRGHSFQLVEEKHVHEGQRFPGFVSVAVNGNKPSGRVSGKPVGPNKI